jgi:hypothetical protein
MLEPAPPRKLSLDPADDGDEPVARKASVVRKARTSGMEMLQVVEMTPDNFPSVLDGIRGTVLDDTAAACMVWDTYLKRAKWTLGRGKSDDRAFGMPGMSIAEAKKGIKGVHYIEGWQALWEYLLQHGMHAATPAICEQPKKRRRGARVAPEPASAAAELAGSASDRAGAAVEPAGGVAEHAAAAREEPEAAQDDDDDDGDVRPL